MLNIGLGLTQMTCDVTLLKSDFQREQKKNLDFGSEHGNGPAYIVLNSEALNGRSKKKNMFWTGGGALKQVDLMAYT